MASVPMDVDPLPHNINEDERRESSTKFTAQIIIGREMESRRRPWFKVLPARTILRTMYASIATSTSMQPFHLIGLGTMLLDFVKKLSTEIGPEESGRENDRDKYLEILEMIFVRLKKTFGEENHGQEEEEASKKFLDSVWELHTNGTLDLSRTNIPGIMMKSCPRLDNVLASCLGGGSTILDEKACPSPLIPLCDRNPETFLGIMQFLRIKYFDCSAAEDGQQHQDMVLNFGCRLQKQLRQKLCQEGGEDDGRYVSLFPSAFQPLVQVLSEISKCPAGCSQSSVFRNEAVIEALCYLVNRLSHETELVQFNPTDVIFILCTIPDFPYDAIFNRASVKYNGNLWLKRVLKRSELVLPISV